MADAQLAVERLLYHREQHPHELAVAPVGASGDQASEHQGGDERQRAQDDPPEHAEHDHQNAPHQNGSPIEM